MERMRQVSIFVSLLIATVATADWRTWQEPSEGGFEGAPFLVKKAELLTKTEAGEIRLFRAGDWNGSPTRMQIVIVTMEPNTLLIPHYMESDLIIFLQTGEAKIGWSHENDLVERRLKPGGVLRIPAGSSFYFINTRKDQRLQMITSIQPIVPERITNLFKPFFISGGVNPPSIFNGFAMSTLTSAFNATPEEVRLLSTARYNGTIIFITGEEDDHLHQVTGAMKSELKNSRRLEQDGYEDIEMEDEEKKRKWWSTWTRILNSVLFGEATTNKNEAPDAYNVYEHDSDFKNDYRWSIEVNEHDYSPLKESDISVFLVNLNAGSMMAPHLNPRATEYGVVTAGAGTVEVVYPNGTSAMKAKVKEGDMFWVPRFYPFCHVAAREGPMEIVGFTTSSKRNRPQFLVGKSSILRSTVGKKLAPAFGMTEEELRQLVRKQEESVFLPGL